MPIYLHTVHGCFHSAAELCNCHTETIQPAKQKVFTICPFVGSLLTSGLGGGGQCFTSESGLLSFELQGSFISCYPNHSLSLQGTPHVEHSGSGCPNLSRARRQPWIWPTCHPLSMDDDDGGDDAGEEEGNGKENDKIAHRICGCCAWSSNPPRPSHPIPMREILLLVPFHRWEKPSLEWCSVVNCTWPHRGWWLSYQSAFQLLNLDRTSLSDGCLQHLLSPRKP